MKRKHSLLGVVIIILFVFSIGCAGLQLADPSKMSNMEFATVANGTYAAQYDDYVAMAARTDLTEDQKRVLRVKKTVLTNLEILLTYYSEAVKSGGNPSAQYKAEIQPLTIRLLLGY